MSSPQQQKYTSYNVMIYWNNVRNYKYVTCKKYIDFVWVDCSVFFATKYLDAITNDDVWLKVRWIPHEDEVLGKELIALDSNDINEWMNEFVWMKWMIIYIDSFMRVFVV